VLIGVATPNDLINDALRTPFNIGQRVDLTDFTLEEALPLANGFDLPLDTAQRALSWVLKWTSGHPYLTQRLCKVLATTKRNTWTEADVDLLVQDTFIKEKSASDNNLQFVRDMLIRRLPDNNLAEEVLITYRDILCGKFVTDEERSLVKSHLKLSGVVTNKGGMLCVRNQIYREVFNDMWIGEHLAPISLHQIPSPPVDFTGREAELLALKEIMSGRGMGRCVLVGMGGVGKTALALKLAADLVNLYSDADLYLDLKGNDPQPLSVTTALQYLIRAFEPAAQLPDDVAQLQSIYRSVLHGKHALILLDNAKDAAQVAPLLPPTTCGVIITSRHSMHVAGLRSLLIDTLPPDAARAFLLKIAPHIGDSADEVARLLGYLPLALELAASAMIRSSDLTTQRLLLQLSKASGQVDLTLEASFQLSYDQLDSGAQARLRALSVFPTSFNDTAASVIWEIDVETAQDILSNLMAFSVVNFNPSTARYRMHDLVQSFVAARLSKEESHIVHERHARYFLTVLANANDLFIEGNEAMLRGLKLFDDERANIETGQSWAATNALSDSAAALLCLAYPNVGAYVLSIRQHLHESISWLKAALSASRFVENRVAENATLGNLGLAYSSVGETSRAIELFQKQLIIARELGDQRSEGAALGNLAIAYWSLGETRRAIDNYKCQIDISQEIGDQRSVGIAFGNLGLAYASIGEIQHAIELFQKQLMIARELGDRRSEGAALGNLGTTYASIGEI
jgi:tetratricopeptide (TPR) repeat protein